MSDQKRKAVITGSSKGIGKAIAERFAQEGMDVYLLSSNENNLKQAATELKSRYDVNIPIILRPKNFKVALVLLKIFKMNLMTLILWFSVLELQKVEIS